MISSEASGSSELARRGPASTMVTADPNRSMTWPSSSPTEPPPMTSSDEGTESASISVAVGPVRHALEHRGDERPLARRQDERPACRHGLAVHLDSGGTRDAGAPPPEAGRPCPRGARRRRGRPSASVASRIASGDRRPVRRDDGRAGPARDAPPLGQQVGRPHHHLGRDAAPVRALAADQLGVDPDHVEPGVAQVLGDLSPLRVRGRRRSHRPPRSYRPPQLVIWTGATIGVPTSSWIW